MQFCLTHAVSTIISARILAHQLTVFQNQVLCIKVFQPMLRDKELAEICPSVKVKGFSAMATQAMYIKEKEKQPQKEEATDMQCDQI